MSRLTFALLAAAALAVTWTPYLARAQTTGQTTGQAPPVTPAPADTGPSAICTDRPTKSNDACAVDPGMWQLETDLLNGTFQRLNGVTTDTWYVTNPTLKYGIAKNFDLEVNLAPYEFVRTRTATSEHTLGSIGDLYLRLKYAAFASADGITQVSVVPYIKAPTARTGVGNGVVEGGVLAPIQVKLNDQWGLTFSPEADAFKDATGTGRHFNTSQTVNIGYSFPADLTVYGELWGDWNFDPAGTAKQYSLDFAVTKLVDKRFQLDGGVNLGLNHATPGVQVYAGISKKW